MRAYPENMAKIGLGLSRITDLQREPLKKDDEESNTGRTQAVRCAMAAG